MAVVHYEAARGRGASRSTLNLLRVVVAGLLVAAIGTVAFLLFGSLSPPILLKTAMAIGVFALLALLVGRDDPADDASPGPWG